MDYKVIEWREVRPDEDAPGEWQHGKSIPAWMEGKDLTKQREYVRKYVRETCYVWHASRIETRVVEVAEDAA